MKECYGVITKVPFIRGRYFYNAVVRMSNAHILCARYDFSSEDEAREWLESMPVVGKDGVIYVEEVR